MNENFEGQGDWGDILVKTEHKARMSIFDLLREWIYDEFRSKNCENTHWKYTNSNVENAWNLRKFENF
ncbi:MAG: hypothetical protein LBT40_16100 [Deltaproteobacteria bacterium]|jgi:hypothetical protein|nr:hypothetical protein [Deltaproteobacteria bacterium]